MTRVQKIVQSFLNHIKDQNVLEAACGRAEFAICASTYAKSVHCIDLTDSRLLPEASEHTNLFFQRMDAAKMDYPSASFDTVVLYNTIAHLGPALEQVVEECLRVLRSGGTLLIISSFKMDKNVIREELIPLLKRKKIEWKDGEISAFYYMAVISC